MSHFAGIQFGNANNPARSTGNRYNGITARVNGWESGIEVIATHDSETGKDVFKVYSTTGSKGITGGFGASLNSREKKLIAVVTDTDKVVKADVVQNVKARTIKKT